MALFTAETKVHLSIFALPGPLTGGVSVVEVVRGSKSLLRLLGRHKKQSQCKERLLNNGQHEQRSELASFSDDEEQKRAPLVRQKSASREFFTIPMRWACGGPLLPRGGEEESRRDGLLGDLIVDVRCRDRLTHGPMSR